MSKQETTIEEVKPMRELVIFLYRIKKNLTNKNEAITIQLIIDTVKNEFFEKVSKWQQEQDKNKYSEEEVLKLILKTGKLSFANDDERIQWFEQFKKK